MISQTAEYALRAIVYLAGREGAAGAQDISETTKVGVHYLAKVLQQLNRAGLVRSRRGLGGGYELDRAPEEITVLDVLDAVDPLPRIRTCPLGIPEHGTRLCSLHRKIDEATATIETAFRESTIADLIDDAKKKRSGCSYPLEGRRPS